MEKLAQGLEYQVENIKCSQILDKYIGGAEGNVRKVTAVDC